MLKGGKETGGKLVPFQGEVAVTCFSRVTVAIPAEMQTATLISPVGEGTTAPVGVDGVGADVGADVGAEVGASVIIDIMEEFQVGLSYSGGLPLGSKEQACQGIGPWPLKFPDDTPLDWAWVGSTTLCTTAFDHLSGITALEPITPPPTSSLRKFARRPGLRSS